MQLISDAPLNTERRVTICLPVFNGADFIEAALASIHAQSLKDFVVLVSDNASTDETAGILERWATRLPLRLVKQPATIPMIEHFNFLLDHVETPYYMLLCHDDYFSSPQSLAKAMAILEADAGVSAVYCDLTYVDQAGRHLHHRSFGRSGKISANALGQDSLLRARNMFGIPLLVRRDALQKHRYDARLTYVADVDLSWMISKDGDIFHLPEFLIANRFTGYNHTWKLLRHAEQQFCLLAQKHGIVMSVAQLLRLRVTNFSVTQQKRLFGLYTRCRGRFS